MVATPLNGSRSLPATRGGPARLPFAAPLRIMRFLSSRAKALIHDLTVNEAEKSRAGFQVAIVIPLGDDVGHEATKLQIEILGKLGHNPGFDAYPHITLKLGFFVTDFAPFENYLIQLAREVPTFEISLRNFGFFDEGILFLDVEANPELEKLRRRILTDLADLHGIKSEDIEDHRYHFHVTLAHGLSAGEFAKLRDSFTDREAHFTFQARHLDLFCHTGHQWVTCRRESLRGSACPAS